MSYILTIILGLPVAALLGWYLLIPILASRLKGLRFASFHIWYLRGLEYRLCDDESSVIPTLRVETAGVFWGGWKEDGVKGLFVVKLEGVSLRVKRRPKREKPTPVETRQKVGALVYRR